MPIISVCRVLNDLRQKELQKNSKNRENLRRNAIETSKNCNKTSENCKQNKNRGAAKCVEEW